MLSVFQSFLKYTYKKSLLTLEKKTKQLLDEQKNYGLELVGTCEGSFTLQLQSKSYVNLFGDAEVGRALEIIDGFVKNLRDEEYTLSIVRQYPGHVANVFLKLLELIIKQDIPLQYKWIMPSMQEPKAGRIVRVEAIPVYNMLISRKDLGIEKVEFIGRVNKADRDIGKWKAVLEENGKEVRGELSERSEMTLDGIVINSVLYRFKCEETIEEITGTGKEKKLLIMISYDRLS